MSKLFEALTRGQSSIPDLTLEPLLEGQTGEEEQASPVSRPEPMPANEPMARTTVTAVLENDPLRDVRTVTLRVPPTSPVLPFDGTHWQAGEQYRMLRTRIIQHPRQPQMFVVTSGGPNDGKTVTVINLAGALALKSESRVLLLDGDFRRSTVCTKLGIAETPGLADVLKGDCTLSDAIVQAEQIPNLYILPAGKAQVNPTELLDSSNWASVCSAVRAGFEHIVVDSPPLGAVADYDLIQAACDGVILVTRPDHTDRKQCMKTLQAIPKDKMIGVIVNCVKGWLLDRDKRRYGAYYYTGQ